MGQLQKLHPRAVWLFFISYLTRKFWLLFFFGLIMLPYGLRVVGRDAPSLKRISLPSWIWFVIIAIIIFDYIWARLTCHFYRYQLADNAVKIERGVIWKKYVSIPYERVQNIDIYRSLWARILGLSDIHIQTAGLSTGGRGRFTEGRLPGLDPKIAEDLREELIKKIQGTKQGL